MKSDSVSKQYVIPCLVQALFSMVLWGLLIYITIYWTDAGFSHFQVGVLVAIFPFTSLVLMIPFGLYVDRIAPKNLVIASYLIFAAAVAGLMLARDFWTTAVFMVIAGSGAALFNNAAPALYYKTMGEEIRGFKLGVFSASLLAGYGFGPLLAGYLYSCFSMSAVFIFSLAGLVPLIILSLFLSDTPGHTVALAEYRADLSDRSVLIFLLLIFFYSIHAGSEQSNLSLYLNKEIGLDKEGVGWMLFIHANVMAILSVVNGVIGDRFSARGRKLASLLYAGIFISGVTNMSLFFATNFSSVLATRLSHAVGDSMTNVTRSIIISNIFTSSRMGGSLGVVTTAGTMATLSGSLIAGAVPGYSTGFVIAGALAVLAVLAVLPARPDF